MKYIKSTIIISLIALLYIFITIYIGNLELINKTIFGNFPAEFKIKIFTGIYIGWPYTHTLFQFTSIILIAILSGINLFLLSKRIIYLRHSEKLHLILGGSFVLGLATGGCATCGIPLLAFLGLTGSLSLLPFEGNEFSVLSIALLLISLTILINDSKKPIVCKTKPKKIKKYTNFSH